MAQRGNATGQRFKRALLVILDSVGIGAMPDCGQYNDPATVATLQNTARAAGGLKLPNLERLGLGLLGAITGVKPLLPQSGCALRASPKSQGKDTTTGHWEIAGHITTKPFCTFPQGFPAEIIDSFIAAGALNGILANCAASGTDVIRQHGAEHLATGKPIVYTSADSVFQIACH